MASESRFGYEWDNYHWLSPNYERQFLNWTYPLQPEDWRGKQFLDVGCGMGRNSYWPLRWGAHAAVAFDNDDRSVARAKKTLGEFPNAEVYKKSVYDIDWKEKFDIVFSLGVVHHLEKPREALGRMVAALKPGGTLLIWVYSYEDNKWIVRYVNPVRIYITSKLPPSLVHFLAYFCSIPLFVFLKIFNGPTPYFRQIAKFDFWHIHAMVFDQLIPTVANYWTREEVGNLAADLPLENLQVTSTPEGTGWILVASKLLTRE